MGSIHPSIDLPLVALIIKAWFFEACTVPQMMLEACFYHCVSRKSYQNPPKIHPESIQKPPQNLPKPSQNPPRTLLQPSFQTERIKRSIFLDFFNFFQIF